MSSSTTESSSRYNDLEKKSVRELLTGINREDASIAGVVKEALPQIERMASAVVQKMKAGGRLFYIGAGTSGRLAVLDAAEIPPTYGLQDTVIAVIAGGDNAIRRAVEHAEDDPQQAWKDLSVYHISPGDFLIGIAASGTTPYVLGGLQMASSAGVSTGCIVCNQDTPVAKAVDFPVEVVTGAEFVTGSTRMKAGTAQKMVLNMISTTAMISLGRVQGNKMVEMQINNKKLISRAVNMLIQELQVSSGEAHLLLQQHKTVRKAVKAVKGKA